jgi:hypothetical protein
VPVGIVDVDGVAVTVDAAAAAAAPLGIVDGRRDGGGPGAAMVDARPFVLSIPHHETFSTTIQPPYSSTKG